MVNSKEIPSGAASGGAAQAVRGPLSPSALPGALAAAPRVLVVCGHYGVGKTNLCLNLACDLAHAGRQVTLVDLDVVNPYFRSSDYPDVLQRSGVELLKPAFAQTALDAPMLSGAIATAIEAAHVDPQRTVVIDAGGDDAGATALGSFSGAVKRGGYWMLYVVNAMREQTLEPSSALALLHEIEHASHCAATHVVNNTHLQRDTDLAVLERGVAFASDVSRASRLPILCTTCPARLGDCVDSQTLACDSVYLVQEYVVTPWDA